MEGVGVEKKTIKGVTVMAGFIVVLIFITLLFIGLAAGIRTKSRKNRKNRNENSSFIPPFFIGDSHDKQNHHDSNDSSGGFGDFGGGDGGGGD